MIPRPPSMFRDPTNVLQRPLTRPLECPDMRKSSASISLVAFIAANCLVAGYAAPAAANAGPGDLASPFDLPAAAAPADRSGPTSRPDTGGVGAASPFDAPPDPQSPFSVPAGPGGTGGAAGPAGRKSAGASGATELLLFQDIPVVVAAGKRVQTQQEAPASVTVVSDADIELFGYQSLADVLRDQRSFYLHTSGLNWFAGVRGLLRPGEFNSSILVTVDGRPTNELIYNQTHLDQDFVVPMGLVKRVEIVRGPGSALYGTNADLAVINVVTKDGKDLNGGVLRLQGGTQESGRAALLYGAALPGGWDLLAGATGYTSQGSRDIKYDAVSDAAHNFGHIRNFDAENVESAFLKLRNGDLTLQADFADRDRDNRSATYDVSFSDPGTMHEQRANITLRLDHDFGEGKSLHAMAYYGRYYYEQHWLVDGDPGPPPVTGYHYQTIGADEWAGEEVHYDWQVNPAWHLLAGVEGRQSLFTHQYDRDTLQGPVLNIPASFNSWGVFTEATYRAADWLSFTGGCRYDKVQRTGDTVSPRFAAVLNPTRDDTVKLLYGRAFRTPSLYELTYDAFRTNVPNPNLKPEIVDTYEAVWEGKFAGGCAPRSTGSCGACPTRWRTLSSPTAPSRPATAAPSGRTASRPRSPSAGRAGPSSAPSAPGPGPNTQISCSPTPPNGSLAADWWCPS